MEDQAERRAVEWLLEDESLTADLIDPAAKSLLSWGISQVREILQETHGVPEERATRLMALRDRIRDLARQAGHSPPEAQASRIEALLIEKTLEPCEDQDETDNP